jgi:FPC/CPF motif-containing protein YcgG
MRQADEVKIITEFIAFLNNREYPCVAARVAISRNQIPCMVAKNIACPNDDVAILNFIYNFIDDYRATDTTFHSVAILFSEPCSLTEQMFEQYLWQRLQSLATLDAKKYNYDNRVDADPSSENFSFSLKQEAFFIIGLNPQSSRPARRFRYPALVFNPHAQFEELRKSNQYEKMKGIVRKRDLAYSGSINPMLKDFGSESEAFQYSGVVHSKGWQCPLKTIHERPENY